MNKIDTIKQLIQGQKLIDQKLAVMMKQSTATYNSLTILQIDALMMVLQKKQMKMSEFAEQLNLTKSGATQLVNTLFKQNQIERISDPSDRRTIHIRLTPQWLIKMLELENIIENTMSKLFEVLDHQELSNANQIIQKIANSI